MTVLRIACVAVFVAGSVACAGSGASERCQQSCARDAECHEEEDQEESRAYKFDRDECEATCAALERDDKGKALVKRHAECLAKATSCTQVMACR